MRLTGKDDNPLVPRLKHRASIFAGLDPGPHAKAVAMHELKACRSAAGQSGTDPKPQRGLAGDLRLHPNTRVRLPRKEDLHSETPNWPDAA